MAEDTRKNKKQLKIGILTFHNADNYGAVLQCYALQEKLKKNFPECDVSVVDYRNTEIENATIFSIYTTKDFGETTTLDEIQEHYFYPRNIDRTDLDLIEVVKKLGNKANGTCSELKIVEIPDGIEFELSEYDGLETVEEKHRSWY